MKKWVQEVLATASRRLFGRRVIYTDVAEVHDGNILDVLREAAAEHLTNQADIDYLYRYYKGDQPILQRVKQIRPEINNTIVENRANEIVSFKTGYLMGEPVQYVSRKDEDGSADDISRLNDYMLSEDKASSDAELADWFHICGTSYRMVLPDGEHDDDEAPFELYTPDPRFTFIVYSRDITHRPMMAVQFVRFDDGRMLYYCYTPSRYYEIDEKWAVLRAEDQILGIPIVEYPANNARLGAFEIVIPLLDAINTTESNRIDGVEQFIQALLLFHNTDISDDDFGKLKDLGAIKFKDIDPQLKAEIQYLTSEMNQAQTQTLVDSMYNTVLTICGMPNRNGGSSTSDTGTAVVYRDGWSAAETRAKDSERMFKKSEKQFLKLALRICEDLEGLKLKTSSLEIRFTRRNYENISEKANVLTAMLNNPKIAPQLAFSSCGMFSDPQLAYRMSLEYIKEAEELARVQANPGTGAEDRGNSNPRQTSGSED